MTLILKVMKVKFALKESYFTVFLFTIIFILTDFSGVQFLKKYNLIHHFGLLYVDFQTLSFLNLLDLVFSSLSHIDLLLFHLLRMLKI